jgi:hypothetical protein
MGLQFKNNLLLSFVWSLIICLSFSACFKDIPTRTIVYENNFEDTSRLGLEILDIYGKIDSLKKFDFNNTHVFGRFHDNSVILKLEQLPIHNVIKIEFDLYLHDDWKGNFIAPGGSFPDIWQMKLNNTPVYITTFSNGNDDQSFPDNYQSVLIQNKAFSNAWGKLVGVCSKVNQLDGTSYYKIEYLTGHQGDIELSFQDVSFTSSTQCEKSWSIDNLRLTAINQLK